MACETCRLLKELLESAGVDTEVAEAASKLAAPIEKKVKRKASAYSKKYGRAFKKVAGKYKLKSGKWAKDGFKRAQKAAHKMAKTMK
jgi:roadblock/LC7 domain-containing protein